MELNKAGFRTSMCRFFVTCAQDFAMHAKEMKDYSGDMEDDAPVGRTLSGVSLSAAEANEDEEEPILESWENKHHVFALVGPPLTQMSGSLVFFGFQLDNDCRLMQSDHRIFVYTDELDGDAEDGPNSVHFPTDVCEIMYERLQMIEADKSLLDKPFRVIFNNPETGAVRHTVDFSIEQITNHGTGKESSFGRKYVSYGERGSKLCHPNLKSVLGAAPWNHSFKEEYDEWTQNDFVAKLQVVLGTDDTQPDPDYMLTEDSTKKILTVLTRFNVGLPTIIMGSTGCGKTSMVHFIARLLNYGQPVETVRGVTFFDIRADGGTSQDDIIATVTQAMDRAKQLQQTRSAPAATDPKQPLAILLFIDECNACNCMGLIEDIMCKGRFGNEDLTGLPLRIIAACNPFQKMPQEAIDRLESAGLGSYSKGNHDSKNAIAGTPMRHLVYRVNPIPRSMSQYLFDFGSLSLGVERSYIRKIVEASTAELGPPWTETAASDLIDLLFQSQKHMRNLNNEFGFVSLRDVKRAIKIFLFFWELDVPIRDEELKLQNAGNLDAPGSDSTLIADRGKASMIIAIALAYRSRLTDRESYDNLVALVLDVDMASVDEHVERVQMIFAKNLHIGKRIALNAALTENAFTLIVCMQLGIPLTLVGKPGSSKSLSKTVVEDTLRGKESDNYFFKTYFKKVEYFSYLCSQHSTSKAIQDAHRSAKRAQKLYDKDADRKGAYVAVLVLDEVGLAEDSEHMPLKVLHRLLDDEAVGFLGISNWSLDPAKMNRGLFLSRAAPEQPQLVLTAKAIATNNVGGTDALVSQMLDPIAKAYVKVYKGMQPKKRHDFFGLRDFYFVLKELQALTDANQRAITREDVDWVVRRNFGGGDNVEEIVECFKMELPDTILDTEGATLPTSLELIKDSLKGDISDESRFLLLMTESESDVMVSNILFERGVLESDQTTVIAGSMFAGDSMFTNTCRDVHKVKTCMETGRTIVLLFCDHIFECLYDLLNKYWSEFGDQRFVELGLGQERGKCKVDPKFRLVVVEKKDHVMTKYAIPLLNRFQKQSISLEAVLTDLEKVQVNTINQWIQRTFKTGSETTGEIKGVVGFTFDCTPALVLALDKAGFSGAELEKKAHEAMFDAASADAVIRILHDHKKDRECQALADKYFEERASSDLYLTTMLSGLIAASESEPSQSIVTTFSPLQTPENVKEQLKDLNLTGDELHVCTLHEYSTEQHFLRDCKNVFQNAEAKALVIMCDTRRCKRSCRTGEGAAFISYAKYKLNPEVPPGFPVLWIINCFRGNELSELNFTPSQDLKVSHIDAYDAAHSGHGIPLASMRGKAMSDLLKENRNHLQDVLQRVLPSAISRLRHDSRSTSRQEQRKRTIAIRTFFTAKLITDYNKSAEAVTGDEDGTKDASGTARGQEFALAIGDHVVKLIEKREQLMLDGGKKWLHSVVKSSSGTHEDQTLSHLDQLFLSGTVSAVANRHICSWVTSGLSILMGAVERNAGTLRMVEMPEFDPFYLEMIRALDVEGDCALSGQKAVVDILQDGAGGSGMNCRLPFSWMIQRWAKGLKNVVMKDDSPSSRFSAAMAGAHLPILRVQANAEFRNFLVADVVAMLYTPSGIGENSDDNVQELMLIQRVLLSEATNVTNDAGQQVPDGVPDIGCIYEALWDDGQRFPRALERVTALVRADRNLYLRSLQNAPNGYSGDALCQIMFVEARKLWEGVLAIENMGTLRKWIARANAIRPVINLIELNEVQTYEWQVYLHMSLFVTHVHREVWDSPNGTEDLNLVRFLFAQLQQVSEVLHHPDEMQSPDCICKLHALLDNIFCEGELAKQSEAAGCHESYNIICSICEEWKDEPCLWKPSCKHPICETCYKGWVVDQGNDAEVCSICRNNAAGKPEVDPLVAQAHSKVSAVRKKLTQYFVDVVNALGVYAKIDGRPDLVRLQPTLALMSKVVKNTARNTMQEIGLLETVQFRLAACRMLVSCADQAAPGDGKVVRAGSKELEDLQQKLLPPGWQNYDVNIGLMYATVYEDLLLMESISKIDKREVADLKTIALKWLDTVPYQQEVREAASELEKVRYASVTRFAINQLVPFLVELGDNIIHGCENDRVMGALMVFIGNICSTDTTTFGKFSQDYFIKQVGQKHSMGILETLAGHIEKEEVQGFAWLPRQLEALSVNRPDVYAAVPGYQVVRGVVLDATVTGIQALANLTLDGNDLPRSAMVMMAIASFALTSADTGADLAPFKALIPFFEQRGVDLPSPKMLLILNALCNVGNVNPDAARCLTDNIDGRPQIGDAAKAVLRFSAGNDGNGDLQIAGLLVHVASALLSSADADALPAVLRPLRDIVENPAHLEPKSFLPGMPDPVDIDLDELRRTPGTTEIRKCTNNHVYIVGNCGEKHYTEKSTCRHPGCGVGIGGGQGILVNGGGKLVQEANEGFFRQDPQDEFPDIRGIPAASVGAMRCLVDAACLASVVWAAPGEEDTLRRICGEGLPAAPHVALADHFLKHFRGDLEGLGKALHGNADDAVLMMHLLIDDLFKPDAGGGGGGGAARAAPPGAPLFASCVARKDWEILLLQSGLKDLVDNHEDRIKAAQDVAEKDENCSNLMRLVQELLPPDDGEQYLHSLWRFRTTVTTKHFWDKVRDARNKDQESYKPLGVIAKFSPLLVAVQCLPRVFRLQQRLVAQLDRRPWASREYCEGQTIKEHILRLSPELAGGGAAVADDGTELPELTKVEAEEWLADVEAVRVAYNIVHGKMFEYVLAKYRVAVATIPETLDGETPLAYFLPSSSAGKGVLSMSLLNALVHINNDFLYRYKRSTSNAAVGTDVGDVDDAAAAATDVGRIAISSVHASNIAGLDQQGDLLPVVLKHSTIPLESRHGSKIKYDFDEIEWQLSEQLVRPARMIDLETVKTANTFTYSTDLCNNHTFTQVRTCIPQAAPAPGEVDLAGLVEALAGQNQLAEAVETLESTISFLAATESKSDGRKRLGAYLTEILQYSDDNVFVNPNNPLVATFVERIELRHVLAVWQRCEMQATLTSIQVAFAKITEHIDAEESAAQRNQESPDAMEADTDDENEDGDAGGAMDLEADPGVAGDGGNAVALAHDVVVATARLAFPALIDAYHQRLTPAEKLAVRSGASKCPEESRLMFLAELREYLLTCSSSADYREQFPTVPDGDLLAYLNAMLDAKNDENGIDDALRVDELPDMEWLDEWDPAATMSKAAGIWAIVASFELESRKGV